MGQIQLIIIQEMMDPSTETRLLNRVKQVDTIREGLHHSLRGQWLIMKLG